MQQICKRGGIRMNQEPPEPIDHQGRNHKLIEEVDGEVNRVMIQDLQNQINVLKQRIKRMER